MRSDFSLKSCTSKSKFGLLRIETSFRFKYSCRRVFHCPLLIVVIALSREDTSNSALNGPTTCCKSVFAIAATPPSTSCEASVRHRIGKIDLGFRSVKANRHFG